MNVWCWDSNLWPSDHTYPPITTRPGLPPYLGSIFVSQYIVLKLLWCICTLDYFQIKLNSFDRLQSCFWRGKIDSKHKEDVFKEYNTFKGGSTTPTGSSSGGSSKKLNSCIQDKSGRKNSPRDISYIKTFLRCCPRFIFLQEFIVWIEALFEFAQVWLDGLYNFRLLWQRKFGKVGLEFCQKLTAKILFYKDWKFLSNLVVRPQIVTPNFWYILWYQIIAFGQPIIKQLMDWPHCGLAIKMCCTY